MGMRTKQCLWPSALSALEGPRQDFQEALQALGRYEKMVMDVSRTGRSLMEPAWHSKRLFVTTCLPRRCVKQLLQVPVGLRRRRMSIYKLFRVSS